MRRNPGEDEPDGLPAATALPIWLISACAALALHAGSIATAAYYMKPAEVEDDLGAPAVEVGIEFAAPHLQPVRSAARPTSGRCRGNAGSGRAEGKRRGDAASHRPAD
ncbi:MAG: hypothetical protein WDN29_12110 [Methylovirgula sp.]